MGSRPPDWTTKLWFFQLHVGPQPRNLSMNFFCLQRHTCGRARALSLSLKNWISTQKYVHRKYRHTHSAPPPPRSLSPSLCLSPQVMPHCSCQMLTFFLKMLQADYVCVRKHAFEMLFNLSLHLNLLRRGTQAVEEVEIPEAAPPPQPKAANHAPHHHHGSVYQRQHSGTDVGPAATADSDEDVSQQSSSSHQHPGAGPGYGRGPRADPELEDMSDMSASWYVNRIQAFHREMVWILHELLHYMVSSTPQTALVILNRPAAIVINPDSAYSAYCSFMAILGTPTFGPRTLLPVKHSPALRSHHQLEANPIPPRCATPAVIH